MRSDMAAGLRGWRDAELRRDVVTRTIEHDGWTLAEHRAPLGVVGFVFEGRPNVFADACGVVRTGNAVVFRIGSDALGTARAIVEHALGPALSSAGLPAGAVQLVDSPAHAAGHALFSDRRLSLAVARGSGPAVAQLGAVAAQSGVPVSLHGTGGAWIVADAAADAGRVRRRGRALARPQGVQHPQRVRPSLAAKADELVPALLAGAATRRGSGGARTCGCTSSTVPRRSCRTEWFDADVEIRRAEGFVVERRRDPATQAILGLGVGVGGRRPRSRSWWSTTSLVRWSSATATARTSRRR